ncbi:vitamin B12-dependent ribonucleotide reductase [bacterium]|nr:vitamin B12-dependent ribonucleotide reductase [bacterium]
MTSTNQVKLGIGRHFTEASVHPYDMVEWELRDSRLMNHATGEVAFEQAGVEVPLVWSQSATNIVAQKYLRGSLGSDGRESSLRDLIDRVVNTITAWGDADGYFADDDEREAFRAELSFILLTQRAAFNSPVWFNIGVADSPQQASACFILSVEDSMESIKDWWAQEAIIFQGGSGAGANLSHLRGSSEPIGGSVNTSSGPLAFMQAADAAANAIKSGGKTRRAAKMVILDVDHPDIVEFVAAKKAAEDMARALSVSGFDMSFDSTHASWIPYQNANNSVRVTDEFMQAVEENETWRLKARLDGHVVAEMPARELMCMIAEAAWACGDPGLQFDTTANKWHTCPSAGRINGSNPCSEYMHLDDSSCNLASLNLLKFLDEDGGFELDDFLQTVTVIFMAQDILTGHADYPTEKIAETSRRFRQLGIGYTNLGALLMATGLPYDSEEGRYLAATITALMTGQSYLASAQMAERLGAFEGFEADRGSVLKVLRKHTKALKGVGKCQLPLADRLYAQAMVIWEDVNCLAQRHGIRNAQASVLAPTGTISFMMDCDTTGIEPDYDLVKTKLLVGGGSMKIVNQTIERALRNLKYSEADIVGIIDYIEENSTAVGAPKLEGHHLPVFATANGENAISAEGHLLMMAAVQPFLSGAISKTVNLPNDATVEDIEAAYVEAWHLGLKAVAVYRDGCKVAQPLSSTVQLASIEAVGKRELPKQRESRTYEFSVAGTKCFVHVGLFADGSPGEIFFHVTKQGSTMSGIMDNFGIALSLGLQQGVPLESFVKRYVGTKFEPHGMTDDPELRIANSILDYVFRRLALDFLSPEARTALNIFSSAERTEALEAEVSGVSTAKATVADPNAPMCQSCGLQMRRAGSCYVCEQCGTTSGCS